MTHRSRRPLLGLAYLLVLALLVASCIAVYQKAWPWQARSTVTVVTQQVGLGLRPRSDVKFQGLLVGEVREVSTTGTVSTITLGIEPDRLGQIPADVDALVVPKTLFGDKYVDLRRTSDQTTTALAAGSTITPSGKAVELGEIFDELVPVLRTLQPERVSAVLTSLADAVDGRGRRIARTMLTTRQLLDGLKPSYDDLAVDIERLGATADIYADSAEDLMSILSDTAAISADNLVRHESDLEAMLDAATKNAGTTREVLQTNRDALMKLTGRARPVLSLLRTYSGDVPCVLRALDYGNRLANLASGVRGPYIGLSVDMVIDQPGYDYPTDLASHPSSEANVRNLPAEVPGWGSHCPVLPKRVLALPESPPPYSQSPYAQVREVPADGSAAGASGGGTASANRGDTREALARTLAAQEMGVAVADLPAYAALLMLPLTAAGQQQAR